MPKNPISGQPLSFIEIVMRADAETIKAAYEARVKVDGLLAEREEAYRRIAELEQQVETIVGETGVFVFPEPPLPVSGFVKAAPVPVRKATPKPAGANRAETDGKDENESDEEK